MSENAFNFILVLLVGSGGQLLDGTMGMGFGVFSASLLLAAGYSPMAVVPTVNMAKILTGALSGLAHWRVGNVRRDWLLPFLLSGVAGGISGTYLLVSVSQEKFRFWMALVLVCMGMLMMWRVFFSLPKYFHSSPAAKSPPVRRFILCVLGLIAGILNSASGAYGPFATSALIVASKAKPAEVVGTVNIAEFFVATAVVMTFLAGGGLTSLSPVIALALTLGGAVTAPVAAYVCRSLPPRLLQLGVGVALVALNLHVVISSFA